MAFHTLALMLGYRCNARCRSCLWGDELSRGPTLDPESARGWIDQACAAAPFQILGFSGGEAFLYLRTMRALAAHAFGQHQLASAASTNGYWATSRARAAETLGALRDAGLRQLLISVDDFHQEHVPLPSVARALEAAQELGIVTVLQCIVTRTSRRLAYYLKELGVEREGPLVSGIEIPCTRVGWAETRIPAAEFPSRKGALSSYCSMLRTVIILPPGTVHLCCGPVFALPQLGAGNIVEEPLAAILERAEQDPIRNALFLGNGPLLLSRRLRGPRWSGRGLAGFSTSCEACHRILGDPGALQFLRERLEPESSLLFLKRNILEQEGPESLSEMLRL